MGKLRNKATAALYGEHSRDRHRLPFRTNNFYYLTNVLIGQISEELDSRMDSTVSSRLRTHLQYMAMTSSLFRSDIESELVRTKKQRKNVRNVDFRAQSQASAGRSTRESDIVTDEKPILRNKATNSQRMNTPVEVIDFHRNNSKPADTRDVLNVCQGQLIGHPSGSWIDWRLRVASKSVIHGCEFTTVEDGLIAQALLIRFDDYEEKWEPSHDFMLQLHSPLPEIEISRT